MLIDSLCKLWVVFIFPGSKAAYKSVLHALALQFFAQGFGYEEAPLPLSNTLP
jgi:hypothetical protein